MTGFGTVQLIALVGWLILSASAFASFRLGARESIRLALTWAGIFAAVMLAFSLAG